MWETLNLFWNWLPWQVLLVIAILGFGAVLYFVAPIWALLPKPIKYIIGFIVSIVIAIQYGRNRGKQSADNMRKKADENAVETRKGIEHDVAKMSDDAVINELRNNRWLRDE